MGGMSAASVLVHHTPCRRWASLPAHPHTTQSTCARKAQRHDACRPTRKAQPRQGEGRGTKSGATLQGGQARARCWTQVGRHRAREGPTMHHSRQCSAAPQQREACVHIPTSCRQQHHHAFCVSFDRVQPVAFVVGASTHRSNNPNHCSQRCLLSPSDQK